MKNQAKKFAFGLIPVLLGGLALSSCGGKNSSSTPVPTVPAQSTPTPSTPVPSTPAPAPRTQIDVLTPFTNEYSRKYNIEQRLEDKKDEMRTDTLDFCNDLISEVTIDHYTDGDTFTANLVCRGVSKKQAIRFYNVDTPETHSPSKGTEPWGMAAAQFTERTIRAAVDAGKKIILEGGVTGIETTYERIVAYVWVDGILLNMQLIEIGLGTYGSSNRSQERHREGCFDANWYRLPINGYAPDFADKPLSGTDKWGKDPNWDYDKNQTLCSQDPIESNVCIKDHQYQYEFVELGPQYEPVQPE